MENNPQAQPQPVQKHSSHKASITGVVLAITSLVLSTVGSLLVNARSIAPASTSGDVEGKVGQAVSEGTMTVLGALLGMPFLVGGIILGILSGIFVLWRVRKVRVGGAIFSVIAVLLVVWSISIALGAFDLIKANPA